MRRAFLILLAIGFMFIFSCAPQKPMTPEEIAAERTRQMGMITRVYDNKKPEEVLLAAARIFSLADDDYTVSHAPTSIQAQRNWMIYLVISATMGTDTWIVEVQPEGSGTKVMARHSGQMASATAMAVPTSNGGMSATAVTSPAMQNMTTRPAIYQLFFARLDNLMGKRSDWVTCRDASAMFTDGNLDPFCTVANDRTPDGKSSRERREIEEKNKPTSGVSIGG